MLAAGQVDADLVLDGATPRLIDEYQLVPEIWNAVRGRVDDVGEKGMFILTGSATPEGEPERHTGARRIAMLQMGTLSFQERGLSTGTTSLAALLAGGVQASGKGGMTVSEAVEALCVGGWPDNLGLSTEDALDANIDYLNVITHVDLQRVDGVRRDTDGVRALLAGYARNVATDASLRAIAATGVGISENTVHAYLAALKRLFLIEDQPAWTPSLRSRVRLARTPKRHLTDPSLAVAALGATPDRLLGAEIELAGLLFESQVIHDLRIYAQVNRAEVRFYRDNKGLEIDAIIEARDGRWVAAEVKLGQRFVDDAARNLLAMREKLAEKHRDLCGAPVVVTPHTPTYKREDGVVVTSLASLGI